MSSLFNIIGEFNELYEMATDAIDEADGVYEKAVAEKAFSDTLESLKGELTEKAAGYVAVMNRLDMEMKKAEEIEKRYKAIKESRKNAIQRMKDACLWACDELGVKEIDAGDMTIKVKNNGGQLPLIIDKPESVPENLTKITIEPDNAKIREYLKDNECDFAHIGERGRHIEVK
jgi:hypothetical protein